MLCTAVYGYGTKSGHTWPCFLFYDAHHSQWERWILHRSVESPIHSNRKWRQIWSEHGESGASLALAGVGLFYSRERDGSRMQRIRTFCSIHSILTLPSAHGNIGTGGNQSSLSLSPFFLSSNRKSQLLMWRVTLRLWLERAAGGTAHGPKCTNNTHRQACRMGALACGLSHFSTLFESN